jgi:two-component system, cell cycle sensor histidine kinase PleC
MTAMSPHPPQSKMDACRVLVAEDDPALQQEYRLAFAAATPAAGARDYRSLESDLFGGANSAEAVGNDMTFDLTVCSQGEEAVRAMHAAVESGRHYSVAFIDVRMPPGIDGITAAERMIEIDGTLNAVIVTGYSDVPRQEIHRRLGKGNLFYFQKPFLGDEFMQLAWALHRRREAERELQSSNVRLHQEVNRRTSELVMAVKRARAASQAKTDFLANMSHELRTPLNAIIGFSDMIGRELIGPVGNARYVEYAVDINGSAQHLLSIINDILDFSKVEAGEMHLQEDEVNVSEVISFCLRLVQHRAAQGNIKLQGSVTNSVPAIRADERKIKQALLNLLSNSVKFTPAGGSVSVTAALRDGALAISVADTGIGMSPDQVSHALEPFGQVDNSLARTHDGTGLGLPLARALVELHGGVLAVESEEGKGTTVTIVLPAERLL